MHALPGCTRTQHGQVLLSGHSRMSSQPLSCHHHRHAAIHHSRPCHVLWPRHLRSSASLQPHVPEALSPAPAAEAVSATPPFAAPATSGVESSTEAVQALPSQILAATPSTAFQPAAPILNGRPQGTTAEKQHETVVSLHNAEVPTSASPPATVAEPLQAQDQSMLNGPYAPPASAPSLSPTQTGPLLKLQEFFAWLVAKFLQLGAAIQGFPAFKRASLLRELKEACEGDPQNPERHAAYLAELNKVNPRDVLTSVESEKFAANSVVVGEYVKALVATGKLSEYTTAKWAEPTEDHRSLTQLLRDLAAKAAAEAPDEHPGASMRRPLHITLAPGSLPRGLQRPAGPLRFLWSLVSFVFIIGGLAALWIFGSATVRHLYNPATWSFGGTAQATTAASTSTSSTTTSSSASTSLEPKEYKLEDQPEGSRKTFKDVVGCDEAKEELKEVVEFLKDPQKFRRMGAKLPKGVLLTGPPGTGKTLLAKAVAGEAGVAFFYKGGSEFDELYVGVGSKRIRSLFAAAKKKAPCIVFIDEVDAVGGNRKHWENHGRKTLNQLLTEMDGFESSESVIVIAATNSPESLDPALVRPGRFDRHVAVGLPDVQGRTEILNYYLQDKPVDKDVDAERLARMTIDFSGADLSNLVNEAALQAAKLDSSSITTPMLEYAYDKIHMGLERASVKRTPEELRHTAYHEAGHAVTALKLKGARAVRKATIIMRGHALGMVAFEGRREEYSSSRQELEASIRVSLAGTVAEELIFGRDNVGVGARSDIMSATKTARYMVTDCGMSDTLGPMWLSDDKLSSTMKLAVDKEVQGILTGARKEVVQLLKDNIEDVHAVAQALLEKETLTADEMKAVMERRHSPGAGAQLELRDDAADDEVQGSDVVSGEKGEGDSDGDEGS